MARAKRILMPLTVALIALQTLACANDRGPNAQLADLGVRVEFSSRNLCSLGASPEVLLGGVPRNTAIYRLSITNVSVLFSPRWQADLPIPEGTAIPEGALESFDLPCPGEKQALNYRFEVLALDAGGQGLAYGWAFASARSMPAQLEIEQQRARTGLPISRAMGPRRPPFFLY